MPNWTSNTLTIHASPADCQDILSKIIVNDGSIEFFQSFLPMPPDLEGTVSPGPEPNWYSWQQKNWGVKWGDCHTEIVSEDPPLVLTFDTPWSVALPFFSHFSSLYRTATLELYCSEEAMLFNNCTLFWQHGQPVFGWEYEDVNWNDDEESYEFSDTAILFGPNFDRTGIIVRVDSINPWNYLEPLHQGGEIVEAIGT